MLEVGGSIPSPPTIDSEDLIIRVRLYRRQRYRCGRCDRRCPRYDAGEGRRRWRALDLGSTRTLIEAEAPRVSCPEHGVVVAAVPWADHNARFTRSFDEQAAWLAVHCSQSAVAELMRVSWRTVGWIMARVSRRLGAGKDQFQGLRRIGIDEVSFRRGQKYLIVVVDHDSGRLVWAAEGRDQDTLDRFFFEVGAERAQLITHVSADAGSWIAKVVALRCPNAVRCMGGDLLEAWLEWAEASEMEPFQKLVESIDENLEAILNTLVHGLSNAIVEGLNTPHPPAYPSRLRLPLGSTSHRTCDAQLWRPRAITARSRRVTHGIYWRAGFLGGDGNDHGLRGVLGA
jgi:transposase